MTTPTLTDTAPVAVAPAADKPKQQPMPRRAGRILIDYILRELVEHPEYFPGAAAEIKSTTRREAG